MGDENRNGAKTPEQQVKALFEETETRTAQAFDRVVSRDAFGEVMAMVTENTMAMVKLGNGAADMVLRNLRLASRRDLTQLGRQLARTEDKLELVLQEVEGLREELGDRSKDEPAKDEPAKANGRTSASRRRRSSASAR